tara:strand:- start:396 stop:821 length:426 start_codon:yes stop_codon:yes gene_type:complete
MNRINNNDPANAGLTIVLLSAAEADGTLEDYDTLAAILAGSNTEATFTNYARKDLSDLDISAPTPDDTNNRQEADFPNQTWASAGGASNNTLVKLIVCYNPDITSDVDANIIPLTHHDFAVTTNGGDLTAEPDANGFYRAA